MTKREYAEAIAKEINGAEVKEIEKANGVVRIGITVSSERIAPIVYIDNAYEDGKEIEEAVDMVNAMISANGSVNIDTDMFTEFENVKDKIRARLYSNETKAEVFESARKYGFEDLILVPYIENVIKTEEENGSVKINNALLKMWGVDAETVMETAMANVEYVIGKFLGAMTVVSNDRMGSGAFGASSVIKARRELEEMFPNGYVVIPSSVHEVIVQPYPETEDDYNYMLDIVREINDTQLAPEERLSYNVYKFAVV